MDGFCDQCGMAPTETTTSAPDVPAQAAPIHSAPRPAPVGANGEAVTSGNGDSARGLPPTPSGPSGAVVSRPVATSGSRRSLRGRSGSKGSGHSGRLSGRSGTSARGMLGAGMVQVPFVATRDPSSAIMRRPEVPEDERYCGACQQPVGRSRDGRAGRTEGFCRSCGTRFSFTPKLNPGDRVQGQYEVLGCLAHGGLGWIYLARDRNVDDRWVVLKGLLNTGDLEAYQGAAAERSFLAGVEHPNIVKIYNFVRHPDPVSGMDTGHIVMEYVGGKSLKELLVERRKEGSGDALPLEQVIAYALEVLRALGYLHNKGLLFCDFKPDNVIQSEEQIKLIDLGGVRRIDDQISPVYATPGYRVPEAELRDPGPTIAADLYTVGRSMAVLSFPFSFVREHPHTIPPRHTVPLLEEHESYDRFLRRATDPTMGNRFQDANEMAEQLTGVLREVLAHQDGQPRPATSNQFTGENFTAGADSVSTGRVDWLLELPDPGEAVAALPVPLPNPADPAADQFDDFLDMPPADLAQTLRLQAAATPEIQLLHVWALIANGDLAEAGRHLHEIADEQREANQPTDWRLAWYWALYTLREGQFTDARHRFDALYNYLPGEAAPKLGLAIASELEGQNAASYYDAVWTTDHTYVSAGFGLARIHLSANGDRSQAVRVLDTVPQFSIFFIPAQMAAINARVLDTGPGRPGVTVEDIIDAGARLERLGLQSEAHSRLGVRVLTSALTWLSEGGQPPPDAVLLDDAFTETGVRARLENAFRDLARFAPNERGAYELIDKANAVRPRTLT
ncbi:serine/threonine-protein kinase [Spiractinospora alimapuensis]|uniref:serine/threonine-protein kinase n=1 Tax=Spiractinospora alimapuensis TaxID=2820884 RepID=UPI001F1CADDB|nr:serine/threonine-protein kinase [Spiractinospora alimapuensis]